MTLPIKAVDRLFERLGATYGNAWTRMWDGLPITDVKSAWAHELAGFSSQDGLRCLAWALENLPERCPNVIEFRNLARKAPMPEAPRLPEPKADPERVKRELAKLGSIAGRRSDGDGRVWARRILARLEAGERLSPISIRFATEALNDRHSS